jgi:anti-sigma regulatory factor (Ser/Thr protein kinase)
VPESVGTIRRFAREVAERCGADDRMASDITLAVSEAATNVVVHAYQNVDAGTLALAAEAHDGEVCFEVIDQGAGLIPRADSPGLGLGLPLIAHLTERFEVRPCRKGRGTELFMVFRLTA